MNRFTLTPVVWALGCIFVVCSSSAQTPAPSAAEIHQSDSVSGARVRAALSGGYYRIRGATMVDLIGIAWSLDEEQIVGGPNWLSTHRFEVSFAVPADATPQILRSLLQQLLVERFRLVTHPATRPFPQYVLTTYGRLRLKKSAVNDDASCRQQGTPSEPALSCSGMTLAQFANELPRATDGYFEGGPIADKTGLTGRWDFAIRWTARNLLPALGQEGISIFEALEKQLGLRVEIRKVLKPVLAVDSVARVPTPNAPGVSRVPTNVPARFEIASVKRSGPGLAEAVLRRLPGGRVELRSFTLRRLIKFAWDFQDMDVRDNDEMLIGGPSSLNATRFDIAAKAPTEGMSSEESAQPVEMDSLRRMLRTLLVERFHFASHEETRPVSVYVIVAENPKLKRADPSTRSECRRAPPARITASSPLFSLACRNTTIPQLAAKLQGLGGIYILHRVVDSTGLDGAWEFTLNWSPAHLLQGCSGCSSSAGLAAAASSTAAGPNGSISVVEALKKDLGLKLRLEKRPMPVLVIDHVESAPSEN